MDAFLGVFRIAPAFCRDAIILGPRPMSLRHRLRLRQRSNTTNSWWQQQQQQSALRMPQTTGTRISMRQQLKKLPSAMGIPHMRISFNGNLRPLETLF
jgi:hypothetical protein